MSWEETHRGLPQNDRAVQRVLRRQFLTAVKICDSNRRKRSMSELTCGVCDCTYNKDRCCCKGDIMVGGKHSCDCEDTCCESFHKRSGDSFTSAVSHPSQHISIDCEAVKCMYNTDYRCHAEHVDIKGNHAGTSGETLCATFREK